MMDRDSILREMGIAPIWRLRTSLSAAAEGATASLPAAQAPALGTVSSGVAAPPADAAPVADVANMDWGALAAAVADCRACSLCMARKQAVLGVGDARARVLFVGEGPGAEEDERGEPFVGQAGKLLDSMLAAIDMKRGEGVYIANTVKCRPPGNRTPTPEETAACFPFLHRQMSLIRPQLIVALGRPAAQTLLGGEVKIGASRGRLHAHAGTPVLVTYHPAYLLRNLPDKAKAWEDLLLLRRTLRGLEEES